jgi:hypothetical protein
VLVEVLLYSAASFGVSTLCFFSSDIGWFLGVFQAPLCGLSSTFSGEKSLQMNRAQGFTMVRDSWQNFLLKASAKASQGVFWLSIFQPEPLKDVVHKSDDAGSRRAADLRGYRLAGYVGPSLN